MFLFFFMHCTLWSGPNEWDLNMGTGYQRLGGSRGVQKGWWEFNLISEMHSMDGDRGRVGMEPGGVGGC
jgi:hypothetical protein